MQCPKCRHENSDQTDFCIRCHTPLRYTCPACRHVQIRGGTCEKCGVDFAKYAAMLVFKAKDDAKLVRDRSRARSSLLKQIILLPITGGLSLLKYFRSQFRGG
jgi:hypothetical protein